jgi:hypothetical protein
MIVSLRQTLVSLLGSCPQGALDDLGIEFDESLCDNILAEASRLGVLPMLYVNLDRSGLLADFPQYFVDRCKESWRRTTLTNLHLVHICGQVVSLLQAAQIPVVALKGIYLAHHIYPHSGMRPMGDIDLLLPEADLGKAREILLQQGYEQVEEVSYAEIQAEVEIAHHLAPFVKQGSPTIELHWHIVKPGEGHYLFPVEELWRRTAVCTIGNVSTSALNREALFLHLCIHVSYHHIFAFGLRPLVDIHTLLSLYGDQMDWNEIVACAASWQVSSGVRLVLAVTHRLFGTSIPPRFPDVDQVPEEMLDLVIEQIFADATDSHNLTLLAKLYSSGNSWKRMKTVLRRIFLQPYPLFSRKYLAFVLTRMTKLVDLYRRDIFRLYGPQRDPMLATKAERYAKIYRWLQ